MSEIKTYLNLKPEDAAKELGKLAAMVKKMRICQDQFDLHFGCERRQMKKNWEAKVDDWIAKNTVSK